ncbi:hypothetical protein MTR67_043251 [Solanum verrucosum]|uniref:Uncharacterized protein n=1 Tax=Solanum verrucosum TaxID=315347 RepID=A0AAF0UR04_SOLVR|nr:hypothetical protein MTR67_043251 [Solanum verrucosum]
MLLQPEDHTRPFPLSPFTIFPPFGRHFSELRANFPANKFEVTSIPDELKALNPTTNTPVSHSHRESKLREENQINIANQRATTTIQSASSNLANNNSGEAQSFSFGFNVSPRMWVEVYPALQVCSTHGCRSKGTNELREIILGNWLGITKIPEQETMSTHYKSRTVGNTHSFNKGLQPQNLHQLVLHPPSFDRIRMGQRGNNNRAQSIAPGAPTGRPTQQDEASLIGPDSVHEAMEKVQLIIYRLKIGQSRQETYADVHRTDLEFEIDDWVFLKVSQMKGVMTFGKKDLPAKLELVYLVFHISLLKKCVGDPTSIVPLESVAVKDSLTYEEVPI